MGKYFVLANLDKKEYIYFVKFWEFLHNSELRMLGLLLRQSTESGGGDISADFLKKFNGRWSGDRITLVGDYDESRLYNKVTEEFTQINPRWNDAETEIQKNFEKTERSLWNFLQS